MARKSEVMNAVQAAVEAETQAPVTVIFRKWLSSDIVVALFPELPSDALGRECDSYERAGQHGGVDYDLVWRHTTRAEPAEYENLKRELEQWYGYELVVVNAATAEMHRTRRRKAMQWWKAA